MTHSILHTADARLWSSDETARIINGRGRAAGSISASRNSPKPLGERASDRSLWWHHYGTHGPMTQIRLGRQGSHSDFKDSLASNVLSGLSCLHYWLFAGQAAFLSFLSAREKIERSRPILDFEGAPLSGRGRISDQKRSSGTKATGANQFRASRDPR